MVIKQVGTNLTLRQQKRRVLVSTIFAVAYIALANSCASTPTEPGITATTERLPLTPTASPSVTPTSTATIIVPEPPYLTSVDNQLPQQIKEQLPIFDFLSLTSEDSSAQLTISLEAGEKAGSWLYLAVAPFYSLREDLKSADIKACWSTGPKDGLPFSYLLLSKHTLETIERLWGPSDQDCVKITDPDELSDALWVARDAVAILPFDMIEPAHKILSVDGVDPLSDEFHQTDYPLVFYFYYQVAQGFQINLNDEQYLTNFDPSKLSSIALTGVTALVRDTANIMENLGVTYPAGDIQDILVSADITHINNEVPFAEDCPTPEPYQVSLRFCSADRYIQLLEAVGADVIELSGDHFGDWGSEAMFHTLNLYQQKGWALYGGGKTLADGLAPVFITHNGNRFAFIGCNAKGIDRYATATENNPGAAQCNFAYMISEISRLKSEGYIVIATMQHEEIDRFGSIALQQYDFRRLAEAGAVIVSGSQSHHPQAIEYTGSSFIHYGLGNLFFDQWHLAQVNPKDHINKDKSFIDLHYFYNGKYIGTRLVTLQFIDNARPRPMTLEERTAFLNEVFIYSLWNEEKIYKFSSGLMLDRNE